MLYLGKGGGGGGGGGHGIRITLLSMHLLYGADGVVQTLLKLLINPNLLEDPAYTATMRSMKMQSFC
jgi:hypothetical protein